MVEDAQMAEDNRNIALIAAADGVPFFKDKHRGCWPFVFRVANLPDSLSLLMTNCHLSMFSAREYYGIDPQTSTVKRYVREPKSLHPHLMIICDDLYAAYTTGHDITDFSVPRGLDGRDFLCRCVLLFWTADYPGAGYARGMTSSGKHCCHWCTLDSGPKDKSISRCVYDQFRRYLPQAHPYRVEPSFGPVETRAAPEIRTHAQIVSNGKRNIEYLGSQTGENAPWKTSGVKEVSPLTYLPGFDIVWDLSPDIMHIVEGALQRHLIPVLKGQRVPVRPQRSKMKSNMSEREWKSIKNTWKAVRDELASWELSNADRKKLDQRSKWLGGEAGWIRTGLSVCQRTGSLKAHDWLKIAEGSWRYLFYDLFPTDPEGPKEEALFAILTCLEKLIHAYSHDEVDDELNQVSAMSHTDMPALKVETAELLSVFAKGIPKTELSPIFHIILHIPDAIYRWGSVRNFWCFWGERYTHMHTYNIIRTHMSNKLHMCRTLYPYVDIIPND